MARSTSESLILYGGGFIILYYILKSWGVIQSQSLSNPSSNWKPLSDHDIKLIKT